MITTLYIPDITIPSPVTRLSDLDKYEDTDLEPEPEKGNKDKELEQVSSDNEHPSSEPSSEAELIIKLPSEDMEEFRDQHEEELEEGEVREDDESL